MSIEAISSCDSSQPGSSASFSGRARVGNHCFSGLKDLEKVCPVFVSPLLGAGKICSKKSEAKEIEIHEKWRNFQFLHFSCISISFASDFLDVHGHTAIDAN